MTWIRTNAPTDARGELEQLYHTIASSRRGIAEVHQAPSLNPHGARVKIKGRIYVLESVIELRGKKAL